MSRVASDVKSENPVTTSPSAQTASQPPAGMGTLKRERTDDGDVKPPKRVMARKECTVCCEDTALNQFPKLPHVNTRQHSSDVCNGCWDLHLKSEVENNGFEKIGCPQCSQLLQEPEVRKLARKSTYADYLDGAAKAFMQSSEEYHACPSADCSWGAFFEKDNGNILKCPLCRYCLSCEVPFHEDQTCEAHLAELAARQEEEEQSVAAVAKISKPCPKCGVNVDKYTGCDHVTCRCRHQFCWECAAPYHGTDGIFVIGNRAHLDSCIYSPARLPRVPALLPSDTAGGLGALLPRI